MATQTAIETAKRNLPADLPQAIERDGYKLLRALDRLGFVHQNQDGGVFTVRFADVAVFGDELAAFWIDGERLWHLSVDELCAPKVARHLSFILRKPVKVLKKEGLYLVRLKEATPIALPARVPLDLTQIPAGDLMLPLGVSRDGPQWISLSRLNGHILVGGTTRRGKSNWMQALLTALLPTSSPEQVQVAIIDPKLGGFVHWANAPHLLVTPALGALGTATTPRTPGADPIRIATTLGEAEYVLLHLLEIAEERLKYIFPQAGIGVDSLKKYNVAMAAQGKPAPPYIVVIVDEFVDLIKQDTRGQRGPFGRTLVRLGAMAAGAGITLVLATTDPKSEIVDSTLRKNCTVRVAFGCTERTQSEMILGGGGVVPNAGDAAWLPAIPGRCVVSIPERGRIETMQAFQVSDELLAEVVQGVCGASPALGTTALGTTALGTTAQAIKRPMKPKLSEEEFAIIEVLLLPAEQGGLGGVWSNDKLARRLRDNSGEQDPVLPLERRRFKRKVSLRRVQTLGSMWKAKGWLASSVGNEGRAVTEQFGCDIRHIVEQGRQLWMEDDIAVWLISLVSLIWQGDIAAEGAIT